MAPALLALGVFFVVISLVVLGALGYRTHLSLPRRFAGPSVLPQTFAGPCAFCNQCGRQAAGYAFRCATCGAVLDPTVAAYDAQDSAAS